MGASVDPMRFRGATLALLMLGLLIVIASGSCSVAVVQSPLGTDLSLQNLTRLAQMGDKHAQLELGIRYEEGLGLRVDIERARELYLRASTSTPAEQIYSVPTGGRVDAGILYSGAEAPGLPYALVRYCALLVASGRGDLDPRCSAGVALEELSIVLSYDMSFFDCAGSVGFVLGAQRNPAGVRACMLDARRRLECTPDLRAALGKAAVLASSDLEISNLGVAIAQIGRQCRLPPAAIQVGVADQRPALAIRPTPLDVLVERQGGVRRPGFDASLADTFWGFVCLPRRSRDRLDLSRIEDALCAIWKSPGADS